jgi:branched-chain amino acid aminotransferase
VSDAQARSGVAEAETAPSWRVRPGGGGDVPAVAAAVEELLIELGGKRPSMPELEEATRTLIGDPDAGALLVADLDGEIVGLLAASWQHAIHVPGRYATIQDLWVHPDRRSQKIGRDLVEALVDLARKTGVGRLEVGLPQESFAAIRATEAFYQANGFTPLGPRMRRLLS